MSVAESTKVERSTASPGSQLAFASLVGAGFLIVSLGLIFSALPTLWDQIFPKTQVNEFLSGSLLLIAVIGAVVACLLIGRKLDREYAVPGSRAGAVVTALAVFVIAWIGFTLGSKLETAELGASVGGGITIGLAGALLFGLLRLLMSQGFGAWLIGLEEMGWFHANAFKPSQGARVRRGTVIAILILGICGIISLINSNTLGSDRYEANDWFWKVPFTETDTSYFFLPLLHKIHVTLPLILGVLLFWFAYRVVNYPPFADFLIATEAEMNKVSWTSRKRLVQDTIVVLVTVFLFTIFLFFIDILWIKVLSFTRVLAVDMRAAQQKQQEKTQW